MYKKIIISIVALLTTVIGANAMSYEQARDRALFLTDKMAYELNLTDEQYDAAYEINLDYLMSVNTVDDVYADYWQQRNYDLQMLLQDWQWNAFCAASYFFRPLYWDCGAWHFGIYTRYPQRDFFFFDHRPAAYIEFHAGPRPGGPGCGPRYAEHFRGRCGGGSRYGGGSHFGGGSRYSGGAPGCMSRNYAMGSSRSQGHYGSSQRGSNGSSQRGSYGSSQSGGYRSSQSGGYRSSQRGSYDMGGTRQSSTRSTVGSEGGSRQGGYSRSTSTFMGSSSQRGSSQSYSGRSSGGHTSSGGQRGGDGHGSGGHR